GASERTIVTPDTGGGREPGCWGAGIGADVGAAHTARGSGGQKLEAAALPGAPQHRSQLAVVLAARVEPDAEAVGARVAADPRDPAGEREGVVRDRAEQERDAGAHRRRLDRVHEGAAAADVVGVADQLVAGRLVELVDAAGDRQGGRDAPVAALDLVLRRDLAARDREDEVARVRVAGVQPDPRRLAALDRRDRAAQERPVGQPRERDLDQQVLLDVEGGARATEDGALREVARVSRQELDARREGARDKPHRPGLSRLAGARVNPEVVSGATTAVRRAAPREHVVPPGC